MLLRRSHTIQHSYPRKENVTIYHIEVPLKFIEQHFTYKHFNPRIWRICCVTWEYYQRGGGVLSTKTALGSPVSSDLLFKPVHVLNLILNFLICKMRKGGCKYLLWLLQWLIDGLWCLAKSTCWIRSNRQRKSKLGISKVLLSAQPYLGVQRTVSI